MESVGNDCVRHILEFLPLTDVSRCGLVCRLFKEASDAILEVNQAAKKRIFADSYYLPTMTVESRYDCEYVLDRLCRVAEYTKDKYLIHDGGVCSLTGNRAYCFLLALYGQRKHEFADLIQDCRGWDFDDKELIGDIYDIAKLGKKPPKVVLDTVNGS